MEWQCFYSTDDFPILFHTVQQGISRDVTVVLVFVMRNGLICYFYDLRSNSGHVAYWPEPYPAQDASIRFRQTAVVDSLLSVGPWLFSGKISFEAETRNALAH
jgi:hypothetical protein